MKHKVLLFALGTGALVVSLYWGITNDQKVEPWTAVASAILYLMGLLLPSEKESNAINQSNIFSFKNSSVIKNLMGSITQLNFFSFGNQQNVEGKENRKNKSK